MNARSVTLSDGRTIAFDLTKISRRMVLAMRDGTTTYDEVLARALSCSVDDIQDLNYLDFALVDKTFAGLIADPLGADPS